MSTAANRPAAPGFDIEALLAPISVDNPVGDDLRSMIVGKSMLMADIEQKRRGIIGGTNESFEPGDQVDPAELVRQRKSEWREVEGMLIKAFSKGKELGAAVTLAQAAVASRGWVALCPCLSFVRLIQERFGDALYPVPETDEQGNPDYIDRLVLLDRLDHENFLPLVIRQLPLTDPRSGPEFSWADYRRLEIMKATPVGKNEDPDVRRNAIAEATKAFDDAVGLTGLEYYEDLVKAMENSSAELAVLRDFVEQRYANASADDRPTFLRTADAIEECHNVATRLLKQKGGGRALPQAESDDAIESGGTQRMSEAPTRTASVDRDVVLLLEQALAYLSVHERHNPAAYLVQEAIRWTKMPIATWYLEANEDASMSAFISKLMRGRESAGS